MRCEFGFDATGVGGWCITHRAWLCRENCQHVRQDLHCSCTAGDEQPNSEHHERCSRQGHRCSDERCP